MTTVKELQAETARWESGNSTARMDVAAAKRVVVKIGTRTLLHDGIREPFESARGLASEVAQSIAKLSGQGREVVLVSSGAVGLGAAKIGCSDAPFAVCAAVGQSLLTAIYDEAFREAGISAAQVLVTPDDLASESRIAHLRGTIEALLRAGVTPIVNENDAITRTICAEGAAAMAGASASPFKTLSDEPLPDKAVSKKAASDKAVSHKAVSKKAASEKTFTDNDMLASLLARAVAADLLILLTDVDGVYTESHDATLPVLVNEIDGAIPRLAGALPASGLGRGGISAKLEAVLHALGSSGAENAEVAGGTAAERVRTAVIANGRASEVLERILGGETIGTVITSKAFNAGSGIRFSEKTTTSSESKADKTSEWTKILQQAKAAARALAHLSTEHKNVSLDGIAAALQQSANALLSANARDLDAVRQLSAEARPSASTIARLSLNQGKIDQMVRGVRSVAELADPSGTTLLVSQLKEGLTLSKVTCPFGVVFAIVEARPDAVVQLAALALKSGNGLVIKAGKEATHTTNALIHAIHVGLNAAGKVPPAAVTLVEGREAVAELLQQPDHIDLVVPRGSAELVRHVQASTRIPVLGHSDGICHIYVDLAADLEMALALIIDAKTSAPATCNAVETVLLHERIAAEFMPALLRELHAHGVRVHGCERVKLISRTLPGNARSGIQDIPVTGWRTEFGELALNIGIVSDLDAAMGHIERFGSHHTDAIVTQDESSASRFLREVDSAGVFHNVSTRYSDGFRYGFGAEVGISTGKLHARGPVGLDGLVTYKYVLRGRGHGVAGLK